jgi:hypothetical protein
LHHSDQGSQYGSNDEVNGFTVIRRGVVASRAVHVDST